MALSDGMSKLSPLCSIQDTPTSGRGVFAKARISSGTLLLSTAPPAFFVIHRLYRKEVCAYCFNYDHGKAWSLRDNEVGLSFCSEICHAKWRSSLDDVGYESCKSIEAIVKRKQKLSTGEDHDDSMYDANSSPPSESAIHQAWSNADLTGHTIVLGRREQHQSKLQRRALQQVDARQLDSSCILYLHSGLLCSIKDREKWLAVLELHQASNPYPTEAILRQNVDAFLHLLNNLPIGLLNMMTSKLCSEIISRDAHNAFGIRSLDDGGVELLGHGVWPEASFWNHSCAPNVSKRREGNIWKFAAMRDIEIGEELCITYLGGDEERLQTWVRRERMLKEWSFRCECSRCKLDG